MRKHTRTTHNGRRIGHATGWTDRYGRPVPADVMARITVASEGLNMTRELNPGFASTEPT